MREKGKGYELTAHAQCSKTLLETGTGGQLRGLGEAGIKTGQVCYVTWVGRKPVRLIFIQIEVAFKMDIKIIVAFYWPAVFRCFEK